MSEIELSETPDLGPLLARAALGGLPWSSDDPSGRLPTTGVRVDDVPIEASAVADYADVCGFGLSSQVPLTFPHVLGFPLSVWLMTRDDFPFGLLGLVHVRNRITAHAPIPVGATVQVSARVANARPHRKGVAFDALVDVHLDGHRAWESASTYLRRGPVPDDVAHDTATGLRSDGGADTGDQTDGPGDAAGRAVVDHAAEDVDPADLPLTGRWAVPADIGRRYGAVSGDRNPIHLSTVTARAFGFPRAIAHGMWTKAAALAGLGRIELPCTIDVAFQKPVLLPSTVDYATRRDDAPPGGGWTFGLRGRDGRPHLAGVVTPV